MSKDNSKHSAKSKSSQRKKKNKSSKHGIVGKEH